MNFLGVVPFLIQWLALMTGNHSPMGSGGNQSPHIGTQSSPARGYMLHGDQQLPPKNYWALLNDLNQLPEDEIEGFLPQITNILVEDSFVKSMDYQTYGQLRQILLSKCAGCLPFGMRVCSLLEAQSDAPSDSIFKVFGGGGGEGNSEEKAERVRYLKQAAETATFYGYQLPQRVSDLRATYMRDMHTMFEHFARIGQELKSYPVQHRNYHLRSAVSALNEMLFNRMLSRGTSLTGHGMNHNEMLQDIDGIGMGVGPASGGGVPLSSMDPRLLLSSSSEMWGAYPPPPPGLPPTSPLESTNNNNNNVNPQYLQHMQQQQQLLTMNTPRSFQPTLTAQSVASMCPEVAAYSLHVPLQHCREKAQRLLQFVVQECEILPSKERCPYLLVAEVIEQDFTCRSSELFAQRQPVGVTALDVLQGRAENLARLHLRAASADRALYDDTTARHSNDGDTDFSDNGGGGGGVMVEEEEEEVDIRGTNAATAFDMSEAIASPLPENDDDESNVSMFARPSAPSSFSPSPVEGLRGGNTQQPLPPPPPGRGYHDSSQYHHPQQQQQQQQYHQHQQVRGSNSNNGNNNNNVNNVPYDPRDAIPPYQQPQGMAGGSYPSPPSYNSKSYGSNGNNMPGGPPPGFLQKKFVRSPTWAEKEAVVQASSPFGHLPGWRLKSFIVKSGDDLRKELLAQQVLEMMRQVFDTAKLDIRLTPYQIVPTGANAGLVEFISTARSIDRMKKSSPDVPTLKEYFEYTYGPAYSPRYISAVANFTKSLVGYSLLTYLLQVRDRHNANLLLDDDGSVIHIDFGFILGDSPGMNMNFENAPFKLTREYVELLGGLDSENMRLFQDLFLRGFFALQQHTEGLAAIVHLFYGEKRKGVADGVRSRLMFAHSQQDVLGLIKESIDNWRTKQYDWFQQRTNGILM